MSLQIDVWYESAGQSSVHVVLGLQTRLAVGPHGCVSVYPLVHAGVHALHLTGTPVPQILSTYSSEPHVGGHAMQALGTVPVPSQIKFRENAPVHVGHETQIVVSVICNPSHVPYIYDPGGHCVLHLEHVLSCVETPLHFVSM